MRRFDDTQMERIMSVVLRFGVILASTLVLAGSAFYLQDHHGQPVRYGTFIAHPVSLETRHELFSRMAHGDAGSIILVGILFLVATPVARVVFAVIAFLLERDHLYTVISAVVLGVLIYSLFFGA